MQANVRGGGSMPERAIREEYDRRARQVGELLAAPAARPRNGPDSGPDPGGPTRAPDDAASRFLVELERWLATEKRDVAAFRALGSLASHPRLVAFFVDYRKTADRRVRRLEVLLDGAPSPGPDRPRSGPDTHEERDSDPLRHLRGHESGLERDLEIISATQRALVRRIEGYERIRAAAEMQGFTGSEKRARTARDEEASANLLLIQVASILLREPGD